MERVIRALAILILLTVFYFGGKYFGNQEMKAAALRAKVAQINEAGEFEFKRVIRFDECNKDGSC